MIKNTIWRLTSLTVLLSCAQLSWAIDDGIYTITSKYSGKVVEVESADTADGANVIQWSANGGATQQWEISNVGGDDYSVVNVNSGKAMEVYDFSTADGGNVTQWEYWGGEPQTWTITDEGDGFFSFINQHSGKSLDLLDWDTSDGANIAQWEWWGGDTQLWALDRVGGNNPDPISVTFEEEGGFCDVEGSVDTDHAGFNGSGFANTDNNTGTGVTWNVEIGEAGTYTLQWRYANGSTSGRSADVLVNGELQYTGLSQATTGGWTTWSDSDAVELWLAEGSHTIRLQATTAGGLANIDSLTVTGASVSVGDCSGSDGTKNPPERSAGCGNPAALASGRNTIISSGIEREYYVTLPSNYDPNEPYRLFYVSHGLGGVGEHVYNTGFLNWFGLRTQALRDDVPAIWIAPTAIDRWDQRDHPLFDDITNLAKNSLCVDTTRVFVAGMSFGGMISYSLSTNHQDVIRAGFGMSPANFNIWLPNPKLTDPIAWMQTTGLSDPTTPWDAGGGRGAKYIALEKARDNGCNVPNDIQTWAPGSGSEHLCVDMQGCDEGYPVKVCTFNGGHIHDHREPGAAESWIPAEAWDFFMQF